MRVPRPHHAFRERRVGVLGHGRQPPGQRHELPRPVAERGQHAQTLAEPAEARTGGRQDAHQVVPGLLELGIGEQVEPTRQADRHGRLEHRVHGSAPLVVRTLAPCAAGSGHRVHQALELGRPARRPGLGQRMFRQHARRHAQVVLLARRHVRVAQVPARLDRVPVVVVDHLRHERHEPAHLGLLGLGRLLDRQGGVEAHEVVHRRGIIRRQEAQVPPSVEQARHAVAQRGQRTPHRPRSWSVIREVQQLVTDLRVALEDVRHRALPIRAQLPGPSGGGQGPFAHRLQVLRVHVQTRVFHAARVPLERPVLDLVEHQVGIAHDRLGHAASALVGHGPVARGHEQRIQPPARRARPARLETPGVVRTGAVHAVTAPLLVHVQRPRQEQPPRLTRLEIRPHRVAPLPDAAREEAQRVGRFAAVQCDDSRGLRPPARIADHTELASVLVEIDGIVGLSAWQLPRVPPFAPQPAPQRDAFRLEAFVQRELEARLVHRILGRVELVPHQHRVLATDHAHARGVLAHGQRVRDLHLGIDGAAGHQRGLHTLHPDRARHAPLAQPRAG